MNYTYRYTDAWCERIIYVLRPCLLSRCQMSGADRGASETTFNGFECRPNGVVGLAEPRSCSRVGQREASPASPDLKCTNHAVLFSIFSCATAIYWIGSPWLRHILKLRLIIPVLSYQVTSLLHPSTTKTTKEKSTREFSFFFACLIIINRRI